jgi:hypothetical protein
MKRILSWLSTVLAFICAGLAWMTIVYKSNAIAGLFFTVLGFAFVLVSYFLDQKGSTNDV